MRVYGFGYRVNRMLLSALQIIVTAFKLRVQADAGTFEAEQCLNTQIKSLIDLGLYDKASLIVTPNAYKAAKIYSLKPTSGAGDLTFARASAAMVRGEDGFWKSLANNVPPLHYPIAGGCPSWLFNPQRTNLFQSSNSRAANWTVTPSITITTPTGVNPQNQATEELLTTNTSSGAANILQTISKAASALQYTFYAILKKGASDWVLIQCDDGLSGAGAWFNINAKTVGSTRIFGSNFTLQSKTIEEDVAGYLRVSITIISNTATSIVGRFFIVSADNALSMTTGNSVFLWQMQLEQGAYGTAPIITPTGSTLTRVADDITTTGLSAFIGQTEGVFAAKIRIPALFANYIISLNDTTVNNRIYIGINASNQIEAALVSGNVIQAFIQSGSVAVGVDYSIVASYGPNYFALFVNGAKVGQDLSVVPFAATVSRLSPNSAVGAGAFQGNLGPIYIGNILPSDAECIALSNSL
jgi:hypothetical protein